ncbi:MAG: hypothetical protein ACFFB3_04505 [Candidatus Hodarchaeota archaeon]
MRIASKTIFQNSLTILLVLLVSCFAVSADEEEHQERRIFAFKAAQADIAASYWQSFNNWGPGNHYNYFDPILISSDLESSAHLAWLERDENEFLGTFLGRFNGQNWSVVKAPKANHDYWDWPQYHLLVDEQGHDHIFWLVNHSSIVYTSYDGAEWTPLKKLAQKNPNGYNFCAQLGSNGTIYLYWENQLWIGDPGGNGTLLDVPALAPLTPGQLFWHDGQQIDIIFEDPSSFLNLLHISSNDNGATWTDPTTIISLPKPETPFGGGAALPKVSIDHNGNFHVAYCPFIAWEDKFPNEEDWYLIYVYQSNSTWSSQAIVEKITAPYTEDWYMILEAADLVVLPNNAAYLFWYLLENDHTAVYTSIIGDNANSLAKKSVINETGYISGFKAIATSNAAFQVFFVFAGHLGAQDSNSTAGYELLSIMIALIVFLRAQKTKKIRC